MRVDYKIGDCFSIGPVQVSNRAVLAPLSGVTDLAFRKIARRFGAGLVVSEMVACDDFVEGATEARLRAAGEGVDPHVVQIAGCDPAWMAAAAQLAERTGATIIDINMGCPAKRVTGGEAGSALMRDLDHAARLIEATVAAVSLPVTVKMRLGWDEHSLNAPVLARRAQDLGARAVTVHGRTRRQFYKGRADWTAIAAVCEAVRIPVIANGDIGSTEDARRCLAASKAAAVMVGRAAMGRPWLVGRIAAELAGRAWAEPAAATKADAAIEHYDGLIALYGRNVGVRHARKHLAAYADAAKEAGFVVPRELRDTLVRTEEPGVVLRLLRQLYREPRREAA